MALAQLLHLLLFFSCFIVGALTAALMWKASNARLNHENSALKMAIDNFSEGYYTSKLDGTMMTANNALLAINKCENDADPLKTVLDVGNNCYVDPSNAKKFRKHLFDDGKVENFVAEMYRGKTDERFWASENAQIINDPKTGEPAFYQGTISDVSETFKRQNVEKRLEILADTIPGGLFQLRKNREGVFSAEYVSKGFMRVLNLKDTLNINPNKYLDLIHEEDKSSYLRTLNESAVSLSDWNVAFRLAPKGLSSRWMQVIAKPVMEDDGAITWHGYLYDVTTNKEAEAQIEKFAFFDALTNLPNRRLLSDRLSRAARIAGRHRNHGALLFIDMDNFKIINDLQGHEAGDKFLKEVAMRLVKCVRSSDTVSRFGGDEFLVVLNDLPSSAEMAEENAIIVANKVLDAFQSGFDIDGVHQIASCSIGIRMFDGSELDADHLIKCADIAMYRAKAEGRNNYSIFHEDRLKELSERYSLQSDLRAAIEDDQLHLLYQPLIKADGSINGVEALIRWVHPVYGLVMPNDFIPGAEESGQIIPVSNWVISKALDKLEEWAFEPALAHVQISVNVSALQFKDTNFVPWLTEQLLSRGIKSGRLKLELTERVLADDSNTVFEQMRHLRDLGVLFALDDFGTGFSCLSQLKQYAFDELKIDGSFVADIEHNASTRALIVAILAMADALGMETVAEKVENELQRDFLKEAGCDLFQGYFYAKPMTEGGLLSYAHEIELADKSGQSDGDTQAIRA